jgi:hypothetical protein
LGGGKFKVEGHGLLTMGNADVADWADFR